MIGGAVIMEQMFAIPGLGRLMIDALFDRDYPLISGINLFFAIAVMTINLFIDLLYSYLGSTHPVQVRELFMSEVMQSQTKSRPFADSCDAWSKSSRSVR